MSRHSLRHARFSRIACSVLFLSTLAVLLPSGASGQIGIRGGVNLTDFFGNGLGQTNSVRSMSYGLSATVLSFGPIDLIAEGYYRKKGAGWSALDAVRAGGAPIALDSAQVAAMLGNAASGLDGQTLKFGLDYIEIPVLLRFNLPLLGSRLRPYVQGGPAFGWRIDCGVELHVAAGGGKDPKAACDDLSSENLEETLRQRETGLVLGGGLAASVFDGAGSVFLDGRLTRGLSRLSDGGGGSVVRNQAFSVLLGYSLGFR